MSDTSFIDTRKNITEPMSNRAFIESHIVNESRLSDSELRSLIKAAQDGDKSAITQVVNHCLRYVFYMALKHKRPDYQLEDIFDDGVVAILKSIKGYDPDRENAAGFLTYASSAIENEIRKSYHPDENNESLEYCEAEPVHDLDLEQRMLRNDLDAVLSMLPEEQYAFMNCFYGLNGYMRQSIQSIADKYEVSRDHVNRVLKKGRESLKSNKRARNIWECYGDR